MPRKKVLFACVGNAFRSQIAEAWARHLADPAKAEIRSGGTQPASGVHPMVPGLMEEVGIRLVGARPKALDLTFAAEADAFVTLCGPLDEACPRHIAQRAVAWDTPDPSWSSIEEMRATRDRLGGRVRELLGDLEVLATGLASHTGADQVIDLVALAAGVLKTSLPTVEFSGATSRPRLRADDVLIVPESVRRHAREFGNVPTAFARDVAALLKRRAIEKDGRGTVDEAEIVIFAEVFVRDHVLGAE